MKRCWKTWLKAAAVRAVKTIPQRSGRVQWHSRNSQPGHNEGGEMKFLWTCSLQAEAISILFF